MESIIFLGLGLNAWLTIALIIALFATMVLTKIPTEFAFLGAIGFLLVTGILDPKEALSGFSSQSVVVVGVLFVVVAGLTYSGVVNWLVRRVLGTPKTFVMSIIRLMVPVALFSSVLSNTTVVALFTKVVKIWSKKLKTPASKLLIPLSYASGLGGICTLIGTPPNLIISGLLRTDCPDANLSIFATTIPGLFCLTVGITTMLIIRRLLPTRKSPDEALGETSEYTAELTVPANSKLVGQTVAECGFDSISGGRLVEIIRFDKEIICPVPDDEFIMGSDHLVFSGQIDDILELRKSHGLTIATGAAFSLDEDRFKRELYAANVIHGGQLIGKSMDETDFEEKHNCVLVAIVRKGERIQANPRSVRLQFADTILLECANGQGNFLKQNTRRDLRFFDSDDIPYTGKRTAIAALIMTAMILLSAFEVLPLLSCCFLAAAAMLVTRCCTTAQAWKSISWEILMIFAGSVSVGLAIERTGIGAAIADGILSLCGTNPYVSLFCICAATTLLTEFISNTAAAAMFYPIAFHTAIALHVSPITFCICLMIAASSSYASPIGSPTHMIVYGEGGYRFTDFARTGLIMDVVMLCANIFIVTLCFPL